MRHENFVTLDPLQAPAKSNSPFIDHEERHSTTAFAGGKYAGCTNSDTGRGIREAAATITSAGVCYEMFTRGRDESPQRRSPSPWSRMSRRISAAHKQGKLRFSALSSFSFSLCREHLRSSFIKGNGGETSYRGCFPGSSAVMTSDILKGANTVSSTVPIDFFCS